MPKYKALLVMSAYQWIEVEALNWKMAREKSYDMWDPSLPISTENSECEVYDVEEIAS